MGQEKSIYAVRITGKDGWQIYNPPVTKAKIIAHLEKQGLKGIEFTELLTILDDRETITEIERITFVNSIITGHGWQFDSLGDCWRAPGESYIEPDKQPPVADSFDIISDPPEHGWWDIGFVISGKEYWITSSNVYDPLGDYHNLMLAVVNGRDIRVTVDEERSYVDIAIYCKTDGNIRLILELSRGDEQMNVDVLINGAEFVQRLYEQMRDFFGDSKTFERGWLQVSADWHEGKDGETFEDYVLELRQERGYPSYPAQEIEKYLAAHQ